mmetsp:Transcript_18772/g.52283  ORF Transcript_18772/g.52283 Transcript_18772/m.52283 type:complete len:351 (+) Transcript_18772:211-1263(+)
MAGGTGDPVVSEYDDVEIVTASANGFAYLEHWHKFFKPYHIVAVHTGDPQQKVDLPEGLDVDLYDTTDFERKLGSKAWIFQGGSSCVRSFGFLFTKRRFIFTIDEGCFVGKKPNGETINALRQHVLNLITPATPFFFNTLYDPYSKGSDFVRGYPFTLRQGVPTALSHGLWSNVPDYDAPTRMCKPMERNDHYVDAVLTVPKGSLFPMSGRNVAFDRKLIGVAMYFALPGKDTTSFIYPDMWAGWVVKVICDHLGLGVKTGLPYLACSPPSKDQLEHLQAEQNPILLQEEIIPFFQNVQLSPSSNTARLCMLELADKVRDQLSAIDPWFATLADAISCWVDVWEEFNPND